ncbi:SH3 domain-containing protein [Gillisia sp. Hel_I_86]|uniref:C40 family peptidase n=1 Tax=Gillisia sp. Hel_I_86 TaxID=1249981 RepID=UPI00119AF06D|nr:C40 family peptidase [Gillisia sp. Hel_I_86]TVZ26629.1 SH3 domain-containing protein [Gillisia sp. Hel_I_86]
MNVFKKSNLLALIGLLAIASCNEKAEEKKDNKAEAYIAEVKQEYAPDKRVALFDVEAMQSNDTYILKGESNLPNAVKALKEKLNSEGISFTDSIQLLPSANVEGKTNGLIKISVANLRGEGKHSAELVTQATLGTPVTILKNNGGWSLIQTPEGYISWVDNGGVIELTDAEFSKWKAADKIIYLNPYGKSFENADTKSQVVSDLVAGDILEVLSNKNGFFEVMYPDGKKAFVDKADATPYLDWVASVDQSGEDLVATAKKMMGLPYLWGGTSPKGVDCSGFTKTIFFLNGLIIPRDASQQVHTGKLIDSTKNFTDLVAGDLLFFGRKATDSTSERVIHVGMWIGDQKFIHSMGNVHISTMDTTAADFDEYNYNRYLRTKRITDQEGNGLLYLSKKDIFMTKNDSTLVKG